MCRHMAPNQERERTDLEICPLPPPPSALTWRSRSPPADNMDDSVFIMKRARGDAGGPSSSEAGGRLMARRHLSHRLFWMKSRFIGRRPTLISAHSFGSPCPRAAASPLILPLYASSPTLAHSYTFPHFLYERSKTTERDGGAARDKEEGVWGGVGGLQERDRAGNRGREGGVIIYQVFGCAWQRRKLISTLCVHQLHSQASQGIPLACVCESHFHPIIHTFYNIHRKIYIFKKIELRCVPPPTSQVAVNIHVRSIRHHFDTLRLLCQIVRISIRVSARKRLYLFCVITDVWASKYRQGICSAWKQVSAARVPEVSRSREWDGWTA